MTDAELVWEMKHQLYSLNVYCGGCSHSRFVHGDSALHPCFYSECGCPGWTAEPEEPSPPSDAPNAA